MQSQIACNCRIDLKEVTLGLKSINPRAPLSAARKSALDVFLLFDADKNRCVGLGALPILPRTPAVQCLIASQQCSWAAGLKSSSTQSGSDSRIISSSLAVANVQDANGP